MENSCDGFWRWGNARKKFSSTMIDATESGFCSILNESSPVPGGSFLKISNEGDLVKAKKHMDATFIRRSPVMSDVNVSIFKCKTGEANSMKSPVSVIQCSKESYSSDTITSNCHTLSCYPQDGLTPELRWLSSSFDENRDIFEEEPSKLMAWGSGSFPADGICSRETCKETSSTCSESENMQLQSWGMKKEMTNLRTVGGSEATSSYMASSCKIPETDHSVISNTSSEIQKKKYESFAALHILAFMAVSVLEHGFGAYKGENERKDSTGRWAIFHPTGVSFWQKRVIRRAKSAFKSNLMAVDSELLLTNKLDCPESIETNENQVVDDGVGDKDHGVIQSVRSSKRTRSQFLSSKYCDSVLQPLKK
ncbi:hypothetical protein KI387_017326, partial [Taxus chinensis]